MLRLAVALVLGATSCEVLGHNETMNCNMVRPGWEYMTDGLMARSQDATQEPFQPSGPNALCAQSQELTNAAIAAIDFNIGNIILTSQDHMQTTSAPFDAVTASDHSDISAQIAYSSLTSPISTTIETRENLSHMRGTSSWTLESAFPSARYCSHAFSPLHS